MSTHVTFGQASTWQDCAQALHSHIYSTANDQCLLWVNPAQMDAFADNSWVQKNRVTVPITHPRFDTKFAPYLVALDISSSMGSDILQQSVQIAYEAWALPSLQAYSGQPVAGWVVTSGSAAALASHWASLIYLHMVDGLTKLLRFHDPSVREWLWPSLSATQQALLLGPATQLLGINRQQQVMQHQLLEPQPAVAAAKKLFLTEQQWQQVEDYAAVHEAWLLQATEVENTSNLAQWRKALPARWHDTLLKALQSVTQYGIASPEDRALFAQHALQMGADFYNHPLLKDVWTKTKGGDFYGGALEEVTRHPAHTLAVYLRAHS
jgi:hypothetical protein